MTSSDKRFLTILGGVTVIAAGGLIYWGLRGGSRYNEAYDRYMVATDNVRRLEAMKPYPKLENLNAKKVALDEYKTSLEALREKFAVYGVENLENVASAEFAARLIKVADKTKTALAEAGTEVPEGFALGARKYTSSPANKGATGLLNYELDAVGEMFESLAASRIDKVTNFMRVPLAEESGGEYKPAENEIARALSMELSLYGTEPALRKFIRALVASEKHYFVIRDIVVKNERRTAPTAEEAKFEDSKPDAGNDPFGGGDFDFPVDEGGEEDTDVEPSGEDDAATPAKPAAPAEPGAESGAEPDPATGGEAPDAAEEPEAAEEAGEPDGERILKQLVGDEKLNVFLRIDVMLFHDKTNLP